MPLIVTVFQKTFDPIACKAVSRVIPIDRFLETRFVGLSAQTPKTAHGYPQKAVKINDMQGAVREWRLCGCHGKGSYCEGCSVMSPL